MPVESCGLRKQCHAVYSGSACFVCCVRGDRGILVNVLIVRLKTLVTEAMFGAPPKPSKLRSTFLHQWPVCPVWNQAEYHCFAAMLPIPFVHPGLVPACSQASQFRDDEPSAK